MRQVRRKAGQGSIGLQCVHGGFRPQTRTFCRLRFVSEWWVSARRPVSRVQLDLLVTTEKSLEGAFMSGHWIMLAMVVAALTVPGWAGNAVYVDDRALALGVQTKMEAALQKKALTPVAELVRQLKAVKAVQVKVPSRLRRAPVQSAAEVYERCKKGVVMVFSLGECGHCKKLHANASSGYVITESGLMVSNYHVINQDVARTKAIAVADAQGRLFNIKSVVAASEKDDIAVLQLDGDGFEPLMLTADAPPPGAVVHVISHPQGNYYYFSSGHVARYFLERKGPNDQLPVRRISITADYGGGSSGAPLLNDRGELVGMVSSTSTLMTENNAAHKEFTQMVFHSCVPTESIVDLLNGKTGVQSSPTGVTGAKASK